MIAAQLKRDIEQAEVWGVREAAHFLGVSADWVYDRAQDGTIPAFKMAKKWCFHPADVRAWFARQGKRE